MAKGDPTKADLEKQLMEMREQLKRTQEEIEKKDEECKRINLDKAKTDEQLRTKDAELAKLRKQPPANIGFVDEGSFELEVEVKDVGDDFIFSPCTLIGGLPFRLRLDTLTEAGCKFLRVFIFCNENALAKTWAAKVDHTITLKSSKEPEILTDVDLFQPAMTNCGWINFMEWHDAVDPSKGFVQNGCFTIKADIKLICYYNNAFADFSSNNSGLADVILHVGGKDFHENKMYLAHCSGFFKVLFLSQFAEKSKDRFEFPEFNADEFEELLKMIHLQRMKKNVTRRNVEYLLRLADYFDMQYVIWQCIDYLKESASPSIIVKLQFTEKYRLPELQHHLVENMKEADDVKSLITSSDFAKFSETLQNYLHAKHFKLFFPRVA